MILTVTANPTIDRVYVLKDFEIGKVHRVEAVSQSAGGKGINVARVAKIMGRETAAMGFLGGYTGAFIKNEIKKQGIKNLFTDINGETRTCVNISDKSGKSGEILEPGPVISSNEKDKFINEYISSIEDYNVICISGSLPGGLTGDFYKELIDTAKEKGKKVIADTSGKALETVLLSKPYMVKPNKDEMALLMKREIRTSDDIIKAMDFLKEKGVEIPFVSLGREGAVALINGVCYKFTIPEVSVVNTVGSGDSMVAGIAVGIDMGYGIIDAVKLGMASGVANTQFEQTGLVTEELVNKFLKNIKINII